jgi:hypothetical protein
VVYEQAPARFIIYTDAQLLAASRLASIRAAFALSHDWTVTRTTRTTAKSPPLQMAKYDQSPSGRARTPGDAAVTPSNYPTTAEALAWLTRQRIPHRQVSPHRIAVGQKINWYLVKGTIVLDAVQRRHHATGFPALEQLLALRQNPAWPTAAVACGRHTHYRSRQWPHRPRGRHRTIGRVCHRGPSHHIRADLAWPTPKAAFSHSLGRV